MHLAAVEAIGSSVPGAEAESSHSYIARAKTKRKRKRKEKKKKDTLSRLAGFMVTVAPSLEVGEISQRLYADIVIVAVSKMTRS